MHCWPALEEAEHCKLIASIGFSLVNYTKCRHDLGGETLVYCV